MNFLHKTKVVAKDHQVSEDNIKIQLDNKHLLDKIVKNKSRRIDFSVQTYHLAMHEKRHR